MVLVLLVHSTYFSHVFRSSVADSVNHVRGGTQHKADNESLAYEGFLAALLEGKVMISFRLAT